MKGLLLLALVAMAVSVSAIESPLTDMLDADEQELSPNVGMCYVVMLFTSCRPRDARRDAMCRGIGIVYIGQ